MMTERQGEGRVGCQAAGSWEDTCAQINAAALFPPASSYALLMRTDDVRLVSLQEALAAGLLAVAWSTGHVFNQQRELRWEWGDRGYALRLLTEEALPSGWTECGGYEVGDQVSLLLFGERNPGQTSWRETRIPHELRYPTAATGRAALVAVPYRRDGLTLQFRWKGISGDGPPA